MEKIKTRYSTLVFLVVFIGAFLSQSLSSFAAVTPNSSSSFSSQHTKYIHSSLEVVNSFGNDLFENETEEDSDLLDFILPNSNIEFQFKAIPLEMASIRAFAEEYTNPIYIMVCNFRI